MHPWISLMLIFNTINLLLNKKLTKGVIRQTGALARPRGSHGVLTSWLPKWCMSWGRPWTSCQVPIHTACASRLCQPAESLPRKGTCLLGWLSGWHRRGALHPPCFVRVCAPLCKWLSVLWMARIACRVRLEWSASGHSKCPLSWLLSDHSLRMMHLPIHFENVYSGTK